MNNLIQILHDGGYSCVIRNNGEIRTFSQRGVADLYNLLQVEPSFLSNAEIADKVVGKGAACLMIIGNIKHLYADVVSKSALEILQKLNVSVSYGEMAQFIQNRDKTGICPVEKLCCNVQVPQDALPLIADFLEKNKK